MSKELFSDLDRDVERLLFAGAQIARTDADLDAKKGRLAPLAAKAPAVAKIVEQIEKVQKAAAKGVASELMNLAAVMAQVRGAQASPFAGSGDLAPLPAAIPVETPLSAIELQSLVGALAGEAKQRYRIIHDAIERGAVRDLRILPFCVAALHNSAISHVVADELLPALGEVIVPELRATLKLQGGSVDARKVRVLATIEGANARALLLEASEKGSPDVRAAAIDELSKIDAPAAEPIALRMLASDRSMEVKKAAAEALGKCPSDAALDALLEAFAKSDDLRDEAGASLSMLTHPKTTARALALLTPELLSLGPFKAPKATTKAQKAEAEKAERAHGEKVELLSAVLDLLANRNDADTSRNVLEVFRGHKIKDVRGAAARALLKAGYAGAFDELAPSVYDADWSTRDDFVEAILKREPDRAFDRLGRFLDPKSFKNKNHVSFAEHILSTIEGHEDEAPGDDENAPPPEAKEDEVAVPTRKFLEKDPRWTDACIALLDHPELRGEAIDVLGEIKSPRALDAVLTLTDKKLKSNEAWHIVNMLSNCRDPRVGPAVVKLIDSMTGYWGRRTAFNALEQIDDPATAPLLRTWSAKKRLDKSDKETLEALLQTLERDRALTGSS